MLSDWCYVFEALHGSLKAVLGGPVTCQRNFFSHFRFPSEILSNSDPEFLSNNTKTFLEQLGVKHWVLLTYNPQFSSRTEVALETKRLLQSKTGSLNSCLDKDCFLLVIMKLCNNPDRDCNLSPAQIVLQAVWRNLSTRILVLCRELPGSERKKLYGSLFMIMKRSTTNILALYWG